MRVILKGTKSCQWDLGKGMRDAAVPLELTKEELEKAEKNKLIGCYVDETKLHTKQEFVFEKPTKKVATKKKQIYTEKALFAENKDWQVKLITKLGLKPASREADRVKQILEAQK